MARAGLILAVALATLVGCRTRDIAAPARAPLPQLPSVPRGSIDPEVSADRAPMTLPVRPAEYRQLTPTECRTLAIRNAPLADDLDLHPGNAAHPLFHKRSDATRLARGYAADELRNRSAADALEEYYKLAVAEGQFDLVVTGHGLLGKQFVAADKAVKEGLKDRGDVNAIRRQILGTQAQAAKLDAGIVALNASLTARLGLDGANTTPLWPADALRVSTDVVEVDSAVAMALQYRPDLNLLRALLCDNDNGGSLANAVLSAANPLLADQPPTHPLAVLLTLVKKDEGKSRQQLLAVLAARARQAEAEVRAAVALRNGNRAAAAAKTDEVRNLMERVAEWQKRETAGQQVTQELVTAQLELLKARGELLQAVADWTISDVKLRQATGMLVRE